MDTLIKIILKKYKFNSSEVFESVVFETNSLSNINLGSNLFEFKEYDKAELLYESSIEDSCLKVESFQSEDIISIKNGQSVQLSPGGDSDYMLSPGFYAIDLIVGSNKYRGLYSIIPNSIDYKSLLMMREILDDMCKGLSNNIYSERSGLEFVSADNLNIDLVTFNYIESNYKQLVSSISSIMRNPIENLTKTYGYRNVSQRPDSKSIRWQNEKKHLSIKNNKYKEKHCVLTYDTIENKLLKTLCENIFYSINYMERKLKGHLSLLNSKIDITSNALSELNNQKYRLSYLNNVGNRKYEINQDIINCQREIEKLTFKTNKISEAIRKTSHCKNILLSFLQQDWVVNLPTTKQLCPTKKFFKRFDYVHFYYMYMDMFEKKNKTQIGTVFSSKKTSSMYEIYSVINTIKALEDIGFTWDSGWIKSMDSLSTFNGDLESGEKIILTKNEYTVELTYDYIVQRASNVKGTGISQIVSSNSNKRKPDILISLFKNNKFIKSMIIEVKYRKESYIYNVNGETDVIHQLKEYRNLDFYDGETNKVSDIRPIQKVIVVYPNAKEKKFIEDIYGFTFISLMPDENKDVIGYSLLKDELIEFLE